MKSIEKIGLGLFLIGLTVFIFIPFLGKYTLSEEMVLANTKDIHQEKMAEILAPMYGQEFESNFSFLSAFGENFNTYNDQLKSQQLWDQVIWDDYGFALALSALQSPVRDNPWLFFGLSIGLAVLGGFLYNFRKHADEPEGIKNNGIFHSSLKNRGLLGMLTGSFLILFYVVLYWFPAYLVNLVWMVNPLSEF
ncbi:MAG TPA: hypothetical protein VLA71_05775, partial [Algoriphagus sp.]|nr:hypothetical protein [Algoriphagus sp.]